MDYGFYSFFAKRFKTINWIKCGLGEGSYGNRMSNNQKMVPVLEMVEENVPDEAVLGTRLGCGPLGLYFIWGKV